jgi:hypothetical protein
MSRTYRRTSNCEHDLQWVTKKLIRITGKYYTRFAWIPLDPESDEYIKALAVYHSDAYRNFKEPGPSWFRNLFTERPQRRRAKLQCKKYLTNPEYEVILNAKDKLTYWT